MKRRSILIVVAIGALVVLITVVCLADPIYRKLLLGWARVLTKEIPATIELGDRRLENARCLAEPGKFGNQRSKELVLWLGNSS